MEPYGEPFFVPSVSNLDIDSRSVHGVCRLPPGYALSVVPPETEILDISDDCDNKARGTEERYNEERNNDDRGNEIRGIEILDNEARADQGDEEQGEGRNHEEHNDENRDSEEQDEPREDSQERDNEDRGSRIRPWHFIWMRPNWWQCVLILSQKHRQRQREKILQANPASHVPRLSSINDLAKGLIAISQTLYASATLYRAKGDQIKQYGFAAFGLTVSPYLIMSIVNLISTLLTPDYPTAYLVRSDAMVEASKRQVRRRRWLHSKPAYNKQVQWRDQIRGCC